MTRNMSNIDRIIRVVVAAVFAYLYFSGIVTGWVGIALLVFATVFVLTSFMSFCPLYTLLGISTCRPKST